MSAAARRRAGARRHRRYHIVRYIEHGAEWATFAANSSVYTSGVLSTGTLTDRSGVVLATANGGSRSCADDAAVRTACYQAVGDYTGNIGTGALKAFSKQLSGYNPITGTYATDGHTVALTLDSSLCVTAYEALAGRKGAVLVSNYKTGEILCMASGPSIDPSSDGDVPDGAYINRCINGLVHAGLHLQAHHLRRRDREHQGHATAAALRARAASMWQALTVKCTGVHGSQTFEDALANSCNCAFAQISLELGADTIESYAKKFGFLDSQSLSGIPTMAGSFTRGTSGSADLAWSGISQYEDLICPYSMLRYVSAIANGGSVVEPSLLLDTPSGSTTSLLSTATANKLRDMMNYNVSAHYGTNRFPGLNLCANDRHRRVGDGTYARLVHRLFARRCAPVRLRRAGGERRRRPDECRALLANTVLQAAVNK
ncbi:MAG: penicillin-binding transpeptidase domain-containing protein [Oscillospiraceae bacterium]